MEISCKVSEYTYQLYYVTAIIIFLILVVIETESRCFKKCFGKYSNSSINQKSSKCTISSDLQ